jgi:hypothetical protein
MTDIPMKNHVCAAKETMETLTGKVDLLRRDMRTMERRHEDDIRRLWVRIAILTVIVSVATGSGKLLEGIFDLLEVAGL